MKKLSDLFKITKTDIIIAGAMVAASLLFYLFYLGSSTENPSSDYKSGTKNTANIPAPEKPKAFLIIDTGSDGLDIINMGRGGVNILQRTLKKGVYFDWDGNHFATHTDWIGPEDAFLFHHPEDKKFGRIDGSNFFETAEEEIELADYDYNHNYKIDPKDPVWKELYLWHDKNSDGFLQHDEMSSLKELSAQYISLKKLCKFFVFSCEEPHLKIDGDLKMPTEYFTPKIEKQNTRYSGDVEIAFASLFLPQIRGFSTIPDLRIAISLDKELLQKLQEFCLLDPKVVFTGKADPLLETIHYKWGRLEAKDPGSRGPHIDARKVYFLEKYFSEPYYNAYTGARNPGKNAATALKSLWEKIFLKHKNLLIAQCQTQHFLKENIKHDLAQNKMVVEGCALSNESMRSLIELGETVSPEARNKYWKEVLLFIEDTYGEKEAKKASLRKEGIKVEETVTCKNSLPTERQSLVQPSWNNEECRFFDFSDENQIYERYSDRISSRYINKSVPADQDVEVHIVSLSRGNPTVHVKKTEKPVILILAGYSGVRWKIEASKEAQLEKIIALDVSPPKVDVNIANIEIIKRNKLCNKGDYLISSRWENHVPYKDPISKGYNEFIKGLHQYIGLIETSFQGTYSPKSKITVPLDTASLKNNPMLAKNVATHWAPEEIIAFYAKMAGKLPSQPRESLNLIIEMMEKGDLPLLFPPGRILKVGVEDRLDLLELDYSKTRKINGEEKFDCKIQTNGRVMLYPNWGFECVERGICPDFWEAGVIVGDEKNNKVDCLHFNNIFWMGPGDDFVNSGREDDIVDAGSGNDQIDLGWGRDIAIFKKGWGQDSLEKTCHFSKFTPDKIVDSARKTEWVEKGFEYINFIVFGPGIYPEDLKWDSSGKITNIKTGDSLTGANSCFNIVLYEDGEFQTFEEFKETSKGLPNRQ